VPAARILLAQRHLALLLCTATLLLKILVPTGYMIDTEHGRLTITVCSGVGPRTVTMEMPGMHGDMPDHGKSKDHGKSEMPCVFSGLSAAALGPVDPIQLAALIAFVMAAGMVGLALPSPSTPPYVRPPLRGPPAYL
jgi:hypothetical protein